MKKREYQLNSVYHFRIRGEVPFSITLKNLRLQEYSSLNVQTTLAERLTACSIGQSTDIC